METMWDYWDRIFLEEMTIDNELGVVVEGCTFCGTLLTINVVDFDKGPFYCSSFCLEQHYPRG